MKLRGRKGLPSREETVQVIIMGTGGRDFHNFNTFFKDFKDRPEYQVRQLEETVRKSVYDAVVIATPNDLRRKIRIGQPAARVKYDFEIDLEPVVEDFFGGENEL